MPDISFDRNKLQELKRLYAQAVKEDKESFIFEEQTILTSYAKYLIEYLTDRLGEDLNTEKANQ